MAHMSYSIMLALVLLTLVCGVSKADDAPAEFDRTTVLANLDEAAAKTDDPEVKRALKKMRECVERSNQLLVLSGLLTLPPEIGQLTNLTWLYLEGNQLTTLPPEIGKLTKLTELQIEKNSVTDTDLEHLKSLTSLRRLNVRETEVTKVGVEAIRKALPNCEIKVPRQHP